MLSRMLVLLVLAVSLVGLAGCGGGADPAKDGAPAADGKPAEGDTGGSTAAAPAGPLVGEDAMLDTPVEEGYGHLKLRFVYDGDAPAPTKVALSGTDQQYCSTHPPDDEALVVNAENKGVANVVVWIYTKEGDTPPKAHPSHEAALAGPVVLDNKDCRFSPHIALVRVGQKLEVTNSDTVGHNTNAAFKDNTEFNKIVPAAGRVELPPMVNAERTPALVTCNIHPWMRGRVAVVDTPYAAVSDANGEVVLKHVPVGTWTLQVWHESGALDAVKVKGQEQSWKKGRVDVKIESKAQSLGDLGLKPALFKK